jgi:hypothetical protein
MIAIQDNAVCLVAVIGCGFPGERTLGDGPINYCGFQERASGVGSAASVFLLGNFGEGFAQASRYA